jgi:hypothetical protein
LACIGIGEAGTFTLALSIYLSAFVWLDDIVLVDLGKNGTITKFHVWRTCFVNLLLLLTGSLVSFVKKNLSDNSYFQTMDGFVLRRDIMELESLHIDPDGRNDVNVNDSLKHRLSCHQQSVQMRQLSDPVEMTSNRICSNMAVI